MSILSDVADIAGEEQARLEDERAARWAREQAARESQAGSEYCVECGFDIDPRRRKAMPSAIRCFGCQEFVDRTAKGYR